MENPKYSNQESAGSCCGPIVCLLLIVGGIIFSVCKNENACGNHPEISDAGMYMMISGGVIIGLTLFCYICMFCGFIACVQRS